MSTILNYRKILFFLCSIFASMSTVSAQSPGNFSTNLGLWLKGDGLATGTQSGTWLDAHSSGNHALKSGAGVYQVNQNINFRNSIHIDDEWFDSPLNVNVPILNVFVVYKLTSNGNTPLWGNGLSDPESSTNDGRQAISNTMSSGGTGNTSYGTANGLNEVYLNHISSINNANSSVFINGNAPTAIASTGAIVSAQIDGLDSTHAGLFIGKEKNNTTPTAGSDELDIAEFIVYTGAVPQTERERINSYLAIKYGLTITNHNYINSASTVFWNQGTNTGFNNDIVGIARDNNSSLNQIQSKSENANSIITIDRASIPNNQALLVGNDGGATNTSTPFQEGTSFLVKGDRINRTWKCQKTGAVNDFNIDIRNTINLPAGFLTGNIFLLVSDDASFNSNLRAYPLVNFSASNVQLNDGEFFTIGRSDAALWVKSSSSDNIISGANINSYNDCVLGVNTMTGTNLSGGLPNHTAGNATTAINFNPYATFNQGSRRNFIGKADFTGFGETGASIFMVLRRDGNNTNGDEVMMSYGISAQDNEWLIDDPSDIEVYVDVNNITGGHDDNYDIEDNIPHIVANLRRTGNGNNSNLRLDGNNDGDNYKDNSIIGSRGRLIFGQEQDDLSSNPANFNNNQEYEGDFAEALVFNTEVSNNDRDAIESYLAIKYGITLIEDYKIYDGAGLVVTWDGSANNGFRNNIGGIGRDAPFELDQRKSKSQNGSSSEVIIEHTAALPSTSHLIWGANNGTYDDITSSGAPTGFVMSRKIWKVQNYNNKIGLVSVTLPVPPSLSGQSLSDVRLIVSSTQAFTAASISQSPGTVSNNEITFDNVLLSDNNFFSLGISENVGYVNLDPGAPTTFEACPGSSVEFNYANISAHPNQVELRDTTGAALIIPVTVTNATSSGGNFSGTINMTIPSDAGTGNVRLLLNNSLLFNFNGSLVVHNPQVEFLTQNTPVCASDTVILIGFPSGGVFSSPDTGFVSTDTLFGNQLDWGVINEVSQDPDVTYTYTPTYINGTPCIQSVSKTKPVIVRDNRLSELTFNYIIKNPPSPNQILELNTSIISSIVPDLFDPSFNFPVSFSGTYVDENNGIYELLVSQAAVNNPVTLRYDNGGCIGERTSNLQVFPPIRIIGAVDTLCVDAASLILSRDPLSEYAQTSSLTSQIFGASNNNIRITSITFNKITSVITSDPAYQGAIDTLILTPNQERYSFDPSNLPPGPIPIEMHYTTTLVTSIFGPFITNRTSTSTFTAIAHDTIHIEARPNLQILNLDSTFCPSSGTIALQVSPAFEASSRTRFEFRANRGFGFNLLDTLQQGTIFDPVFHYDKHVSANDRHLNIELIYVVDRYGCRDRDTTYTQIIAPVQPIFFPQPAYCTSDFQTPLTPSFKPGSFIPVLSSSTFLAAPGLDTINRLFDPSIAGSGDHLVTLQMIDNFGCRSEFTDTLFVRVPPQISLEADFPSRTGFCSNETNIPLNTILISGNSASSVTYFGAGVLGSTLDPSAVFLGSNGGTSPISVIYTDSFGCQGRDNVTLTIRQTPSLKLDSLFNNSQRYCGNDPAFVIQGFVRDSVGQFFQRKGPITGSGIVLTNGVYFYDPIEVFVDSAYQDTVRYTYTDSFGCSSTIQEIIQLDSIPEVSLAGLNTQYCIEDSSDQLIGFPNNTVLFNSIIFGGPGVNPNTGILTPSLAGTGEKIVSYAFVDGNSCGNIAFDTTIIYGLPTPIFGGYLTQYCTAGALDTLESFNLPLVGTSNYRYWGSIVSDTALGVINPGKDSSGLKTIFYTFTDSVGCSNLDSVNVFIHPSPEIVVDGLDSAYCFSSLEDNISVFPSGTLDNSSSSGFTSSGNNLFFDPGQDTAGVKVFTYIYTDPSTTCADTISARTLVYKPSTPTYTGLDNFYCEIRDTLLIAGIPTGGLFSGQGIIDSSSFSPAKAGGGVHIISYTVADTLFYNIDTLVCQVDTVTSVTVRPLPVPTILSPGNNFRFCSTDTSTVLVAGTQDTWNTFTSATGGIQFTVETASDTLSFNPLLIAFFPDTTFYFDPDTVVEGTHFVTYIATDSITGCQDSIQFTYIVDDYTSPFFALDSVYCESADSVILFGVPGGGVFFRDNDTINGAPPYFVPNPNYATGGFLPNSITDTIVYTVQDGACFGTDTQYVFINPVPQISFTGSVLQNTYCLGMDSVSLSPNIAGGIFTGNGVLFGTSAFIPDIAGPGFHPIYYDYVNPITGCSNQYIDTFSVFGMPDIDFDAIGGCQLDSISFLPNNTILGLNNIYNNRIIDSITNITWEFESNVTAPGSHQNNVIDTISHVYNTPGVYQVKLLVSNQTYCTDTQTIRLVISPRVSNFPYDESFEASSGNWYAESRDSIHPLLWEWGIDSTNQGIASNRNNRFWSTQLNNTYSESEDAWVYSPCFDIDSLSRPMVKLDYWSDTRNAADGAVLEYQKEDGTWTPLGEIDRGINWFNSPIITGQPGDQNLAPIGWSGKTNGWTDARYKLDELGARDNLRLRVAFGSPSVNLGGTFYDGFGFDNFWVGSRTRNVLLETTANVGENNMDAINNHVYQLAYHSNINKDLILLQYQHERPNNNDEFRLFNDDIHDARIFFYGAISAGTAVIDGLTSTKSQWLNDQSFEQDMLESPKFDVSIDTFYHNSSGSVSSGVFNIVTTVTALVDIPVSERYRINMLITEDSLSYANGEIVHAVVRSDYVSNSINTFDKSWFAGESITLSDDWDYTGMNINYAPNRFQAVAFIQAQTSGARKVFQASTSRDVSGYLVGVDQVAAEPELNQIKGMNLYPNPAKDHFNVAFDTPLKQDFNWKLVGINGVEYQTGIVYTGEQEIMIHNYDFPPGVYIFMVYNGQVFSQRKVIINQE